MAAQSEDYIFRISAMVAEMLQSITLLREKSRWQEALTLLTLAQEKLFARPCADLADLTIEEQLRLLDLDETAEMGQTKRLAYASLLTEAGIIYRRQGNEASAVSAFQLALYITLAVAHETGDPPEALSLRIHGLLALVPPDQYYSPTAELIERWTR